LKRRTRASGLAAQVRGVQADIKSWSRWANPSAAYTREDAAGTRDEFFLLQQSLPISGRLSLMRKAGRATVGSVEAETAYARILLRSDFRAAFFGLLAAQERLALLESGVQPLREIVRVLGEREKEGESSTFDRLRAERELAEMETTLERARILLVEAQARLGSYLAPGSDPVALKATGTFAEALALPPLEATARSLKARGDLPGRGRRAAGSAENRRQTLIIRSRSCPAG
jgi:cobalt-zinc-cadmium efflux system outer membrane protein